MSTDEFRVATHAAGELVRVRLLVRIERASDMKSAAPATASSFSPLNKSRVVGAEVRIRL
jgi:hypothetical protein